MINWVINKIKAPLQEFCSEEEELRADELSAADWRILKQIRDILVLFYDATKATEGRDATIEHFLPSIEFLIL